MQFLLIAYDGTDPDAINRRMNAREDHLKRIALLKMSGEFITGGAILNDDGKMTGSMIVFEYPDRQALDISLKDEKYINEKVWEHIEIHPFRMVNK